MRPIPLATPISLTTIHLRILNVRAIAKGYSRALGTEFFGYESSKKRNRRQDPVARRPGNHVITHTMIHASAVRPTPTTTYPPNIRLFGLADTSHGPAPFTLDVAFEDWEWVLQGIES